MGDPSTISGLQCWLKADAGTWYDYTHGIPALNGDFVNQWNDQSGNGNNWTVPSNFPITPHGPVLRTGRLNGLPMVEFNRYAGQNIGGASNPVALACPSIGLSYPCTLVIFMLPVSWQPNSLLYTWGSGTNPCSLYLDTGPYTSPLVPLTSGLAIQAGVPTLNILEVNSASSFWQLGYQVANFSFGAGGAGAPTIGDNTNGVQSFDYLMSELCLYNRALTSGDITVLQGYFTNRYYQNAMAGKAIGQSSGAINLSTPAPWQGTPGINDFDYWIYGVPFVALAGDPEFGTWSAAVDTLGRGAVPICDIDQSYAPFIPTLFGISSSSATIMNVAGAISKTLGISMESAILAAKGLLAGTSEGISMASAALVSKGLLSGKTQGISMAQARLIANAILNALTQGISLSSASLSSISPVTVSNIFTIAARQPRYRMPSFTGKFWQRRVSARQQTIRMS
jgi:hypothetical protein